MDVPAGVALSLTVASLTAAAAMLVLVRRQRTQMQLLQLERRSSAATLPPYSAKSVAPLHKFATGGGSHKLVPMGLTIPNPWADNDGQEYIQVGAGGGCSCAVPAASEPA